MGWLNRKDDEIDDRSSSDTVDEGRRGVLWMMSSGKRLRQVADGGGCGASRVFPASVYEWVGGWDGSGEPWLRDALVRNVG